MFRLARTSLRLFKPTQLTRSFASQSELVQRCNSLKIAHTKLRKLVDKELTYEQENYQKD